MAKTRPDVIILRGDPPLSEALADAALFPGHAVELTATGVRKQATADKDTALRVVRENDLVGGTIDDTYATGDNCYYHVLRPGDEAQVRVAAAAVAIVVGDQLEFTGDGTLNKLAAGKAVAEALEAVDNSGGGSEAFIKVQAI